MHSSANAGSSTSSRSTRTLAPMRGVNGTKTVGHGLSPFSLRPRARAQIPGSSTSAGPLAMTSPFWLVISTSTRRDRAARVVVVDGGDLAVEEGHVAGQRRAAVLHVGVQHEAVLACPVGQVVEHPGAHGRAVAVAARHADQARVARLRVTARRALVQAVARGRDRPSRPRGRGPCRGSSRPCPSRTGRRRTTRPRR